MNPPYNGSLHLKILSEAMKHADEIVNLSPVTELKNVAETTKEVFDILPYIEEMDWLSEKEMSKIFGITLRKESAIWFLSDKKLGAYKYDFNAYNVYKKIKKHSKSWRSSCSHEETTLPFLYMQGDNGYAKGWHLNFEQIFVMSNPISYAARLVFKNENEKKNFLNACSLKLYRYIYKLDGNAVVPAHMPWLSDYSHPWTDEMLYDYFDLTPEERETIENEI